MRSFKLLSLALSFAMFSHALPQATRHTAPVERRTISTSFVTHAMEAYEIKDFLISDIVSNEHYERSNKTYFRNISFNFLDPNSNSSILCSNAWTMDSTIDKAPTTYVYCGAGPTSEFFIWKLNTYTSKGKFSLDLAHSFNDPAHFPPPYSYVEYFSTANISLSCSHGAGALTQCRLPASKPNVHGVIDRMSN